MEILKKVDKLEHDILLCFKHSIASTLRMSAQRSVAGAVLGGGLGAWLLVLRHTIICYGRASLYIETALMTTLNDFFLNFFSIEVSIMSLHFINSCCRSRGIEAGLVVGWVAGIGLASTVIAIGIPASLAWLAIQKLKEEF